MIRSKLTLLAVTLALASSAPAATVLFEDDFETETSANWDVLNGSNSGTPDFIVNWAFDYSTNSYTSNGVSVMIPAAPNSSGLTRGVKVAVNKLDDVAEAAAVNLYPKGKSFSGNFALRFDMWINYNGGEYGGTGSTEFSIFGINFSGTLANWSPPAAAVSAVPSSDGILFGVTGEAGAARDYRSYEGDPAGPPLEFTAASGGFIDRDGDGTVEQEAVSTTAADFPLDIIYSRPPQETRGVPGKKWVQVEVRQREGVITWIMDGYVIAEKPGEGLWTSGNIMIGTMDNFNSIANPRADNFVIFDNLRVVDLGSDPVPARLTLAASQASAAEPATGGAFTITRSGDTTGALSVNLGVRGTATSGTDYTALPLATNMAAGSTSLEIPVTVINDQRAEPAETVKLHLVANPAQYEVFAPMVGTVEIADDGDITLVGVQSVDASSIEGIFGEGAVFSIFRSGDTSTELAVDFKVSGTATSGVDFTALISPAVIPAGASNVLVTVSTLSDIVVDSNETVIVTLQAGDGYTVIATNSTFTANIIEPGEIVFQDSFETDNSTNYTLLFSSANGIIDYRSAFGFDYSDANIPASPRGSGSTKGLLLTVNKDDGTASGAASVNVLPKDHTFSGDYVLKFDMFLTYDSSAAGTTEHSIFGINHSGTVTNRHGSAGSDGVWFAIETDGSGSGGGRSYTIYTPTNNTGVPPFAAKPASAFANVFTVPPYLAAGAPSGAWVDVSVRQLADVVTLKIENNIIFQWTNSGSFKAGDLMLGYMDSFNSVGATNNFVIYDNVRVISLGGGTIPGDVVTIGGISRVGANMQILFSTPTGGADPVVEGSAVVTGGYAAEPSVQLESVTQGAGSTAWRATFPISTQNRFFRIRK